VWCLAVDHSEGDKDVLYAGVGDYYHGYGVWRCLISEIISGTEERSTNMPRQFVLSQNYPNPFNPTTKIGFGVSGLGSMGVRLVVCDLLGREVAVLLDEHKAPGRYQVEFDGAKLSSGVYIYRLSAGDFVESKRMILLK